MTLTWQTRVHDLLTLAIDLCATGACRPSNALSEAHDRLACQDERYRSCFADLSLLTPLEEMPTSVDGKIRWLQKMLQRLSSLPEVPTV